jgi:methyl-accepting chemotaxis protein
MQLQNRLFLSLTVMAAAALAIGALSLYTLHGIFDNQSKVYNSGQAVYHLKKVSDAYGLDVMGAVAKVRNADTWAWEDGGKSINNAEKEADDHWKAYAAMDKTKEEKLQATIVGALIENNKHLMETLQNDFANKNTRDLEIQATSVIYPSINPILDNIRKLEDINEKIGADAIAEAEKGFNTSFDFLAVASALILLGGLAAGLGLGAGAIRPLGSLAQGFERNVDQIAVQSQQVSSSSSQLSSNLLESAVQLQKSGSSMEQLVYMAQQNNQEAVLARHHIEETKSSVSAGSESAQRTVDYMKNLGQGAERVFQVVKTIEEIAFQTNILALNAGVEAVRAGDQGKEFVLVVEEIRNLSQRCSQVARETSKLVTDNVRQMSEGVRLSEETGKAIAQALDRSRKADSLLTVIQDGMESQARILREVQNSNTNAEQVAYRNSSIGDRVRVLGSNLAQQAEGLRDISRQWVNLVEGGTAKPSKSADHKAAPPAAASQAVIAPNAPEKINLPKEAPVREKTGTDDSKIVHFNK